MTEKRPDLLRVGASGQSKRLGGRGSARGGPAQPAAVPNEAGKAETGMVDGRTIYAVGTILRQVAGPFDPQTGTVPGFGTLQ